MLKKLIYLFVLVLTFIFGATLITNSASAKAASDCIHVKTSILTKATVKKNGKKVTTCKKCKAVISSKTIYKASSVKLAFSSCIYDGKQKTPAVTVKDSSGKKLEEGTDYTLKYDPGRKKTGEYDVTVQFKGNFSGKKTLKFSITPDNVKKLSSTQSPSSVTLSWKSVKGATGYRIYYYNAKANKYIKLADVTKTSYTVKKFEGKELKAGTDYKFAVRPFAVTADGNVFSPKRKAILTATDPVKVTLKVTSTSKSAVLKWSKVSCNGYEILYASNKSFSSAKKITVKKPSEIKRTIRNLEKGKVYYFKIRAYKNVGSEKIYGYYSTAKSVKVK